MLNIDELRVGDNVKCIDKVGFTTALAIDPNKDIRKGLMDKDELIVDKICNGYIIFHSDCVSMRNAIYETEYKFFEKCDMIKGMAKGTTNYSRERRIAC